jgi:serine/threonine protein kinase/outer membrane protein assembly factor BamD (BamD/ComL family)
MELPEAGSIIFDRYRIEEKYGEGKWGVVLRAQDITLRRTVAIKYLKRNLDARDLKLRRFLQEARTIANLSHPNVVIIYDLNEEPDGDYVIVMEYAEKGTLANLLEASPGGLPVLEVVRLATGVCSGLEAIHSRGVIHRDLKPSNVLLFQTANGQVIPKIADFGIAHVPLTHPSEKMTSDHHVLGTPLYMSPEQAAGHEVQPCSDLFSLGVILYELLTGRLPFANGVVDVLVKKTPLIPPAEVKADIPPRLNDVVIQCLELDPTKRFVAAGTLHEALLLVQTEEEHRQKQIALEQLNRAVREHRANGNWAAAAVALRQILALEPNNWQAQAQLTDVLAQSQLQQLYGEASEHLKNKEWQPAIGGLVRILAVDTSYRDARARLSQAQLSETVEQYYAEANDLLLGKQWSRAEEKLVFILSKKPDYPGAAEQLQEARTQIALARLYAEAEGWYRDGKWQLAVQKFTEIQRMQPNYEDAETRLKSAQAELRLCNLYEEAQQAITQKDWYAAKLTLREIDETRPGYGDIVDQLQLVEQNIQLEELYYQIPDCEKSGAWDKVVEVCKGILEIDVDYEDTVQQLAHAQLQLKLTSLYEQALGFERLNQIEDAVALLEEIVKTQRDFKDSASRLRRLKRSIGRGTPVEDRRLHSPAGNPPTFPAEKHSSQDGLGKVLRSRRAAVLLVCVGALCLILVALAALSQASTASPTSTLIPFPSTTPALAPTTPGTPPPGMVAGSAPTLKDCLEASKANVAVSDSPNGNPTRVSGNTITVTRRPTYLVLKLDCPIPEELVSYQWNVAQGTITIDSLHPSQATYLPHSGAGTDPLSIKIKDKRDGFESRLAFFFKVRP